ncbi:MAG: hypothetical protein ACYTFF_19030 [Planctomycetota bacterium]|jgi:hypothetical protein
MGKKWKRPAVVILAAITMTVLASLLLAPGTAAGHRPNIRRVVVIPLDTTRADDLGCSGGIPCTPNIDAEPLGANGLSLTETFERPDPWPDRMIPLQTYGGTR